MTKLTKLSMMLCFFVIAAAVSVSYENEPFVVLVKIALVGIGIALICFLKAYLDKKHYERELEIAEINKRLDDMFAFIKKKIDEKEPEAKERTPKE